MADVKIGEDESLQQHPDTVSGNTPTHMHRVDLLNQVTENQPHRHGAEPGVKSLICFVMHRNYGLEKSLSVSLTVAASLFFSLSLLCI